jgi:copper chaperone
MTSKTYDVAGMTCEHCVSAVTSEVSKIQGVSRVDVRLTEGTVTVTGDGIADETVRLAVEEAGYAVVGGH